LSYAKSTWWIDSGAIIHDANSIQKFHMSRTIQRGERSIRVTNGVEAECYDYSDLDFAGCLDTERFTSDYVFKLASGAISWSSSKQNVMTSSTIYA
jgi:hypothetical protein